MESSVGSFEAKTHLPALLERVARGERITITKRGKPVAKLVPAGPPTDDIYDFMRGKGKITGDVVSPALTPEEWGDLY